MGEKRSKRLNMLAFYLKKVKTKSELLIYLKYTELDTEYFGVGPTSEKNVQTDLIFWLFMLRR
jgi:hypothetical protein